MTSPQKKKWCITTENGCSASASSDRCKCTRTRLDKKISCQT